MTFRLRDNPDDIEGYVGVVARITGIPSSHIEKDFWITEALRGISNTSRENKCSVVFKGGTSLSKAHRLIERFSEDVDLLIVLPEGGRKSRDRLLKLFAEAVGAATGIEIQSDPSTNTVGVKRSVILPYPTAFEPLALKRGLLIEMGTRGGAIPSNPHFIRSLIAEYAELGELDTDFEEFEPVPVMVLHPVRTLVEKLVLLNQAAISGDIELRRRTARHYYDVDALLCNEQILRELAEHGVDILAREVEQHSKAAELPHATRPPGGFGSSPAWVTGQHEIEQAYDDVVQRLVWPNAQWSTFAECCDRVQQHASLL